MNILVTGACGGMGLAACELLTDRGHTVYGLDIVPPPERVRWNYLQTDLTEEASVAQAADSFRRREIRLDAIIHHAGVYDLNSLIEMTDADVKRIWEVNFFAAVRVNRLFFPLLAPGAKLLLTSSELAPLDPLPFTGIYGITKTAVEKYAFSLRMELNLLGYRVIVLRPGAVRTSLLDVSTAKLDAFTAGTKLYRYNAERFRGIVRSVETRCVPPEKIARLDARVLRTKKPRFLYSVNRNPGLLLLNLLPARLQTAIIRRILR